MMTPFHNHCSLLCIYSWGNVCRSARMRNRQGQGGTATPCRVPRSSSDGHAEKDWTHGRLASSRGKYRDEETHFEPRRILSSIEQGACLGKPDVVKAWSLFSAASERLCGGFRYQRKRWDEINSRASLVVETRVNGDLAVRYCGPFFMLPRRLRAWAHVALDLFEQTGVH